MCMLSIEWNVILHLINSYGNIYNLIYLNLPLQKYYIVCSIHTQLIYIDTNMPVTLSSLPCSFIHLFLYISITRVFLSHTWRHIVLYTYISYTNNHILNITLIFHYAAFPLYVPRILVKHIIIYHTIYTSYTLHHTPPLLTPHHAASASVIILVSPASLTQTQTLLGGQ